LASARCLLMSCCSGLVDGRTINLLCLSPDYVLRHDEAPNRHRAVGPLAKSERMACAKHQARSQRSPNHIEASGLNAFQATASCLSANRRWCGRQIVR